MLLCRSIESVRIKVNGGRCCQDAAELHSRACTLTCFSCSALSTTNLARSASCCATCLASMAASYACVGAWGRGICACLRTSGAQAGGGGASSLPPGVQHPASCAKLLMDGKVGARLPMGEKLKTMKGRRVGPQRRPLLRFNSTRPAQPREGLPRLPRPGLPGIPWQPWRG